MYYEFKKAICQRRLKAMTNNKQNRKLTLEDFKFFTKENFIADPAGLYYNNLQEFSKPIGIRLEEYCPSRDAYDIIQDIKANLSISEDQLSIQYQITLRDFITLCDEGIIRINKDARNRLDEVQRHEKAISPSLASKLIVGIINGDDVMPQIIVIISEDGTVLFIIDGLQRTGSIHDFFRADGFKLSKTNTILDGLGWEDMPLEVRKEILNRKLTLKVTSSEMMPFRANIFRILNTTQTKMSIGETLNTKYWNTYTMKTAINHVHTKPFSSFLGNEDAKSNIKNDNRFASVASLLNVFCVKEICEGNIAPKFCKSLPTFAEQYILFNEKERNVYKIDDEFQIAEHIFGIIKGCFPSDICHKISKSFKVLLRKNGYPSAYTPYSRKSSVSISYLSSLYTAIYYLVDAFETLISVNVKEEIAQAVDELFGSEDFIKLMRNNTGSNAIERVFCTLDAIVAVLDKYNIPHSVSSLR